MVRSVRQKPPRRSSWLWRYPGTGHGRFRRGLGHFLSGARCQGVGLMSPTYNDTRDPSELPVNIDSKVRAPVARELRAIDCNTPEQWAQWARERREYDDPCGQSRTRY